MSDGSLGRVVTIPLDGRWRLTEAKASAAKHPRPPGPKARGLDAPVPGDVGQALLDAGRKIIRFHFSDDVKTGLKLLTEAIGDNTP